MIEKESTLHVLEIPAWYKSNEHPVSATFNEDHARMLMNNGIQVGLIFPDYSGSFIKRIKGEQNSLEISLDNELPTYHLKLHPYVPKLTKINYDLLFRYFCKAYETYVSKYGEPHVIHAHHCFMAGYLAMKLKEKYRIKYVITKLSTPFIYETNKLSSFERKYIEKIINNADGVMFISEHQRDRMEELYQIGNKNIHEVIYLPLNPLFVEDGRRQIKTRENRLDFINIGKLIDVKNQTTLIKAFHLFLKSSDIKSCLKIYGEGPLRVKLENLINELGLQSNVKLMGEASRKDIRNAIANSSFLISSSKQETMGVNIIEAHSQGVPVIALNAGTTEELISIENGVHVTKNTVEDLKNGIIHATETDFDSDSIRTNCLAKFSSESIFEKTQRLYNQILK